MTKRGFWSLVDVSDERLERSLQGLIAKGCRTEARIVAHLAELDARRLSLIRGQSLFEYCQTHLGLSDNQAFYRITAARTARKFPIVFELLDRHDIHLTTIALISKYLTLENHLELLQDVRGKSKREVLKLLAQRFPKADVPNQIRKLPPQAGAFAAGPTATLEPRSAASYCLQLNASEALKEKLDLACDLMSHSNPSRDLALVVEHGLDLLIFQLQRRRFGLTSHPRARKQPPADETNQQAAHEGKTNEGKQQAVCGTKTNERSRAHIANDTRRQLVQRDGLRCTYCSDDGQRCTARAFLQIHHEHAWAKGGPDTIENLRLLCADHNQLLAEREFGARAKKAG